MDFRVKVFEGTFDVGAWGTTLYSFPLIPPQDQLLEVIGIKKGEVLPRYERVRIRYSIEYVNPTAGAVGGFDLHMVCANGEDRILGSGGIYWTSNKVGNDLDITACINYPTPAFGVQAFKLNLGSAKELGGVPLPSTRYKVYVEVYGTWGK